MPDSLVNRAFVLKPDGTFLIVTRNPGIEKWQGGKKEIPGGKLNAGQNVTWHLEDEVLEETGYLVIPITRIVYHETSMIYSGKYTGLPYILTAHITRIEGGSLKLSPEHTMSEWATIEEAKAMDNLTPETMRALLTLEPVLISSFAAIGSLP